MTDVTAETSAPQNDAPAATGFDALKGLGTVSSADEAPVYTQKLDAQGRAYSTGKRKNAIARVWIKPGSGKINIKEPKEQIKLAMRLLSEAIELASQ
jgi:small subunit ribosomal protein S9